MNSLVKKLAPVILAAGLAMCKQPVPPADTPTPTPVTPVTPTPNHAPVISSQYVGAINEGANYGYQVVATDADNDKLIYSLPTAPSWLSINADTGLISGTAPTIDLDTLYPVSVKVSDGKDAVTQDYIIRDKDLETRAAITKGADRLIALQNANGSWDWVVTTATGPTATTDYNMAGVTGESLIDAYKLTGNAKYLDDAKKSGDYIVNVSLAPDSIHSHQNAANILFLYHLNQVSGDVKYKTKADAIMHYILHEHEATDTFNTFDTDGTIGLSAQELANAVEHLRSVERGYGAPIGIVPFDLFKFVEDAKDYGDNDFAHNMAGIIKSYIEQPSYADGIWWYVLGLSTGISALSEVGLDYSSELTKLLAKQYPIGTWEDTDSGIQETAYATMGLEKVGDLTDAGKAVKVRIGDQISSGISNGGWRDPYDENGNPNHPTEITQVDSVIINALSDYIGL